MPKMPWSNLKNKLNSSYSIMHSRNDDRMVDIYSRSHFSKILERERERANRNNHKFSLIVLEFRIHEIEKNRIRKVLKQITARLRIIDEIGWYGPNRIGIILPYTSKKGACQLIKSLSELVDPQFSIPTCTICTYPPGTDCKNTKQKTF
jgi:PleD family two-component response regulator